jgi:TetR/AcrR family transcriptional regulator, regulator of cefoperazone and chloramphenicol sensitivity
MASSVLKSEDTTDRIIDAAGFVFAEQGYRGTTVRQITTRAGVNLAAVNYHFKNKSELYVRVLKEAKKHLRSIVVQDLPGSPEEQLRVFIEHFVHYLLDPKRPVWHGRVLAMEMSNPTPALGIVVRELTAPLYRDVRALVAKVVGHATPEELDLFTLSIFGQCVFYVCSRPVVEQLSVNLGRSPHRVEQIGNHIGAFSLAALKNYRRRAKTHAGPGILTNFSK